MRTTKCAGLVIAILLIFIFGLFFLEWLIFIIMIPLLFFLFSGLISFYSENIDINVIRKLSNIKIFENDKIQVTITIKNQGNDIGFLEIYDTLPKKVKIISGSNYAVLNLKKNEEITINYEIQCPLRGRFLIGPLMFRVKDYFGLFFKEKLIDTQLFLTVIPQIEEIKDIDIKAKSNIFPGIMQTKHSGIGTEFFGIREYTSSDTFKRINWKSFARFNKPMVNEFELESTTDVIILIDSREVQGIGSIRYNPLEYSIRAAVATASHFLKRRDRVGILAYGSLDGKLIWLYPESGKKQLYKIIEEVVSLEPFGYFTLDGVLYEAISHMLPKKSLIIFISSLEEDPSIPYCIENLVSHRFNVIVLSPSPVELEYSFKQSNPEYDIAKRILSLERKNFLSKLRNSGARVIDWNPTIPLAASLKEVEKYQTRR
jgi:uncharacterized protein (DUF58 family)